MIELENAGLDFHDPHVPSLELCKVCFCGVLAHERFCGKITLGNAAYGTPWESSGHIRSLKVLRNPIGKTAVNFLKLRASQSLQRQQLEPLPVG